MSRAGGLVCVCTERAASRKRDGAVAGAVTRLGWVRLAP